MNALRTVRLTLRANIPAMRTQRTNAFAIAMGDKTAMRTVAKLVYLFTTKNAMTIVPRLQNSTYRY